MPPARMLPNPSALAVLSSASVVVTVVLPPLARRPVRGRASAVIERFCRAVILPFSMSMVLATTRAAFFCDEISPAFAEIVSA
ncbi:hypothetical protein [Megasphaera cerevisiae]|uniref:hypothetical protein n=1 Tax=Megasphaera cerevisiae TaxID=39029 RepID=UPI001364DEEF|nr:hypothetical protein [Megasphaera cerevisiae]